MTRKSRRDPANHWSSIPVGPGTPGAGDVTGPEPAAERRWRSYTEHLGDLGYELHGAAVGTGPAADELAQAVAEYRRRSRSSD